MNLLLPLLWHDLRPANQIKRINTYEIVRIIVVVLSICYQLSGMTIERIWEEVE
jgi:hypothetical protein